MEEGNADIFISIHCNLSNESYFYKGVETWYNPNSPESEVLASLIQDELVSLKYTLDRGIKHYASYEPLAALENNKVPAVLIELGFLSNWSDEHYLYSDFGQSQCAEAILNAIINYKKLT